MFTKEANRHPDGKRQIQSNTCTVCSTSTQGKWYERVSVYYAVYHLQTKQCQENIYGTGLHSSSAAVARENQGQPELPAVVLPVALNVAPTP